MDLMEFKKMQEKKGWKRFIFIRENQCDKRVYIPFDFNLTFDTMQVFPFTPTSIAFFRDYDDPDKKTIYAKKLYVAFNGAKSVKVHEGNIIGDTIKIICNGRKYYILAQ